MGGEGAPARALLHQAVEALRFELPAERVGLRAVVVRGGAPPDQRAERERLARPEQHVGRAAATAHRALLDDAQAVDHAAVRPEDQLAARVVRQAQRCAR
jgi:hypothetical protein